MSARDLAAEHRLGASSFRLTRRILKNWSAKVGLAILAILALACLAAPVLTHKDPNAFDPTRTLLAPSLDNPMGTDGIGRDMLARFLYGGRLSLWVGLVATAIGGVGGISLGLVSGYFGGWLDAAISWFVDILLAFPDLLLALAIIAILGPGIVNAMVAVGISFIPSFMRLTRGSVLATRDLGYVEASRALGSSNLRILLMHILPNALRTILVLATLGVGSAILAGAALSFLGLGAQPPTAEWGAMLNAGQKFVRQGWWLTVFPGLGIFLSILSINLVGDAISDAVAGTVTASSPQHTEGKN